MAGIGGQDGYPLPNKAISSFLLWDGMSLLLSIPVPPQPPPCDGGQLRGSRGTVSLHRAPVHNLECVTFRPFHLYFMQNGSREGCKRRVMRALGHREASVE